MDKEFNLFEDYTFGSTRRLLKLKPEVKKIGIITKKSLWHNQRFPDRCAFSIILKGNGQYKRFGKTWQIEAPCVLTQWPDDIIQYGSETEWEELFFRYSRNMLQAFLDGGYINLQKPVWSINNLSIIDPMIKQLLTILRSNTPKEFIVDTVDLLSMNIVANTICAHFQQTTNRDENTIYNLKRQIEDDLFQEWDVKTLARHANMSLSTFRRQWLKYTDISPKQYIIQLKLEKACHLLQETDLRIGEISTILQFKDYFYFTRLFSKKIDLSPSEYRRQFTGVAN